MDDLSNMYGLNDFFGTVLATLTRIFNLYTGVWILSMVLAIWLIRRVIRLFKRL